MMYIDKLEWMPHFTEWSGVFKKSCPYYHLKQELEEKHFGCSIAENQFVQLFFFNKQVFAAVMQSNPIKAKKALQDFLFLVDLNDYKNILKNIRLCFLNIDIAEIEITQSPGPLKGLLPETNGWILYNYQLGLVFRLAKNANYQESAAFVKLWNKKVHSVQIETELINYKGNSLREVVKNAIPNKEGLTLKTPHIQALQLLSLIHQFKKSMFQPEKQTDMEDDGIVCVELESFKSEEWHFIRRILNHDIFTHFHGIDHIFRTINVADLLVTADEKQYYGEDLKRIDLYRVAAFHDAGRTSDGEDLWEDESAFFCYCYLLHCGYEKSKAAELSECILTKNNALLEHPISRVLHDADCIEITRMIDLEDFELERLWIYNQAIEKKDERLLWAIDMILKFACVQQGYESNEGGQTYLH